MNLTLIKNQKTLTLSFVTILQWSPLKVKQFNRIIELTGWEILSISHSVNKSHKRRKKKWQENQW